MKFLRDAIRRMRGYIPGEQPGEEGWVKLNQNENPYPPSPRALAAMREELGELGHYPETSSARVREVAAGLHGVDPAQVLVTNGSDEMLRIILEACVEPGQEVVAFYPSYTYYRTLAAIRGARYVSVEFDPDYGLPPELDLARARVLFLPNPNAPSGTLLGEDEVARLCAAMPAGLVVVDEAYADFAPWSAIPLLRRYPNLFVTRTLSKSYSLAGLRVGLGFGRPRLVRELDKVRDFYDVDRLAQVGAAAALADQEYFGANIARIRATRQRLQHALAGLAAQVWPSRANFVLARFDHPSASELFRRLRERRILVRHFDAPRLDDCLRVSVGTDAETDAFLAALADLVKTAGAADERRPAGEAEA